MLKCPLCLFQLPANAEKFLVFLFVVDERERDHFQIDWFTIVCVAYRRDSTLQCMTDKVMMHIEMSKDDSESGFGLAMKIF